MNEKKNSHMSAARGDKQVSAETNIVCVKNTVILLLNELMNLKWMQAIEN